MTNPSQAGQKATHCLIVSGVNEDHNGAFTASVIKNAEKTGVAPKLLESDCQIFPSWTKLRQYFERVKSTLPPETNQFFILQEAHGYIGGYARCNAESARGKEILDSVLTVAKTHAVAFHADSCYSGDLMSQLIVAQQEANHPEKDSSARAPFKRLCLSTSSLQKVSASGRNQFYHDAHFDLKEIHHGQTMEEAFRKYVERLLGESGLISSLVYRETNEKMYPVTDIERLLEEYIETSQIDRSDAEAVCIFRQKITDHVMKNLTLPTLDVLVKFYEVKPSRRTKDWELSSNDGYPFNHVTRKKGMRGSPEDYFVIQSKVSVAGTVKPEILEFGWPQRYRDLLTMEAQERFGNIKGSSEAEQERMEFEFLKSLVHQGHLPVNVQREAVNRFFLALGSIFYI